MDCFIQGIIVSRLLTQPRDVYINQILIWCEILIWNYYCSVVDIFQYIYIYLQGGKKIVDCIFWQSVKESNVHHRLKNYGPSMGPKNVLSRPFTVNNTLQKKTTIYPTKYQWRGVLTFTSRLDPRIFNSDARCCIPNHLQICCELNPVVAVHQLEGFSYGKLFVSDRM